MRVLHSSSEVRAAIRKLFAAPKRRRVAIVAFVGRGASAYLPRPKGLELYCWPAAGGTSASAIKGLQKRGVRVAFAESVHMKVYWCKGAGAVITSANLSDNALGVGGLHEIGVLVPARTVKIDRLIRQIRPLAVTEARLRRLDVAENARVGFRGRRGGQATALPSFPEWLGGHRRRSWKWGYGEKVVPGFSRRARAAAKDVSPGLRPVTTVSCRRGQYREGDWVLDVNLSTGGLLSAPRWVYVNRVVLVEKSDRVHYSKDWPFDAVQINALRHCPSPPFRVDSRFRRALRAVSKMLGREKVEARVDGRPPTRGMLEQIRRLY